MAKIEYKEHAVAGLHPLLECLECGTVVFDRDLHESTYHGKASK